MTSHHRALQHVIPLFCTICGSFCLLALFPYAFLVFVAVFAVSTLPHGFFPRFDRLCRPFHKGLLVTSLIAVVCLHEACQRSGLTDEALLTALISGAPVPSAFYIALLFLVGAAAQASFALDALSERLHALSVAYRHPPTASQG